MHISSSLGGQAPPDTLLQLPNNHRPLIKTSRQTLTLNSVSRKPRTPHTDMYDMFAWADTFSLSWMRTAEYVLKGSGLMLVFSKAVLTREPMKWSHSQNQTSHIVCLSSWQINKKWNIYILWLTRVRVRVNVWYDCWKHLSEKDAGVLLANNTNIRLTNKILFLISPNNINDEALIIQ